MTQLEFFGYGCIKNLESILKKERSKRIFLVRGKNSYKLSGAEQSIDPILSKYFFQQFYNFHSNPRIEEILGGFNIFQKEEYDTIIAIGGGSTIDVAKAIKLFYLQENPNRKIPLIAIPTTSGSGSEATHFIVYYDGKKKQSKGELDLTLPDYSICDPQLTLSLPKNIVAATGIDALGQAIESYWSVDSTEKSKNLSEGAIRLIIKHLVYSIRDRDSISRERVMRAANLAGKAIEITKTNSCHSISYPLTSYFAIPHGHAVGLSLGKILMYNYEVSNRDCNDKRGVEYVKKTIWEIANMLGVETPLDAKDKLNFLMKNIGLETNLSELGVSKKEIKFLTENAFTPEKMRDNPRSITKRDLKGILENLLK